MSPGTAAITGIGSVSPFGPLRGLIPGREMEPRPITQWPTPGHRRAFLAEPFRPAAVVPGLKTRRLDRLSVWCLVAAALAIEDAKLNLDAQDRGRIAVVLGTGFGCIELTEAFFRSIHENGYSKSDPILFPETLANAPAAHVARVFGLRGPNVTVTCKGVSGEGALIQAAALLRSGQADVAIAIAGDPLTRAMYEWFEAAGALSPACFSAEAAPVPAPEGFVPGEGVAAVVMELESDYRERGAQAYAGLRAGFTANSHALARLIRKALGGCGPSDVGLIISSANGSPQWDAREAVAIRQVFGGSVPVTAPKAVLGEFDASGLLRLVLALSGAAAAARGLLMLLGISAIGGCAAVSLELP